MKSARIKTLAQYEAALEQLRRLGAQLSTIPNQEVQEFEQRRCHLMHDICVYVLNRPREPAITNTDVTLDELFLVRNIPHIPGVSR